MMAFDAFISYATTDKATADGACAALEAAGVRCWIAPRDIRPGMQWGAAIVEAIDLCSVAVLVFSSSANNSMQIPREVERLVSRGKPIVPFRIEPVEPTQSLAYFMGSVHWLDALTPPVEDNLRRLVHSVRGFLPDPATIPPDFNAALPRRTPPPDTNPQGDAPPFGPRRVGPRRDGATVPPRPGPWTDAQVTPGRRPLLPLWAYAVAAVCIVAVGAVIGLRSRGTAKDDAPVSQIASPTEQAARTDPANLPEPAAVPPLKQASITGLSVNLGDSIDQIRQAYKDIEETKTESVSFSGGQVTHPMRITIKIQSIGVLLFLDDHDKINEIRWDAPFAGDIQGIKIGDAPDRVTQVLGRPSRVAKDMAYDNEPTYFYEKANTATVRLDFGGEDGAQRVQTIFVWPPNTD